MRNTTKYIKRILIAVTLLAVAIVVGRMEDWAMGRRPPPPRAVPAGASLVQGATTDRKRQKALPLSFDVLKKWTYIQGKTEIPGFIRIFEGQPVVMDGYMMSLGDVKDIKSFVLVPSLWGCCYGQPPAVNHVVLVRMAGNKAVEYFGDAIRVRGQFHCGEEKQDGYLVSLYHIDADEVVAR
jgi:hypothetical protein